MSSDADETLDGLRRARPEQEDPVAGLLRGRVRAALLGEEIEAPRIGRFTVLERLGSGGMGAVYAAYDPKLDRRVAVKVLHAVGEDARRRVLAEARALARLQHPNVVAVHDASDHGDDVYLAMELIAGRDLRRWLADAKPSPARVLDVFVQAGRGLAAAHAAGLVHGDVKPENVLVGDDGRVKVADFGLARSEGSDGDARAGTPAYMAPEQQAGAAPDAKSDQYAFALALREAMGGRAPTRAIARALASDPAARWPSMAALCDAIAPRPSRWPWLAAVAILAGAVAVTIVATRSGEPVDACAGAAARLATVWNPDARAAVDAPTAAAIDRYGVAWTSMARETCQATRLGEQSSAMLDLRMACLDRRLGELGALLAAPPVDVVAAYDLPSVEPCRDRDQLAGVLPPTAAQKPAVDALDARLDQASARQKTTGYLDAVNDLKSILDDARALGYPPVVADSLLRLAKLENNGGDPRTAEGHLKDAIAQAAAGHDDELLADAWTTRIFIAGIMQHRSAEALAYAEAADAAAARALHPAFWRGFAHLYRGEVLEQDDHLEDAQADVEQAVVLLTEARGAAHPSVAEAEQELAAILRARGDFANARAHAERALAIVEAAYGHAHQDAAVTLDTLAAIVWDEGDRDGAIAMYRDEVARLVTSAGADHPYTATAHHNLGMALRRTGHLDEAEAELDAALAIRQAQGNPEALETSLELAKLAHDRGDSPTAQRLLELLLPALIARYGEQHHEVADVENELGGIAQDLGDLDEADRRYRQALAAWIAALGPDNPKVSVALSNLGDLDIARKHFADARDVCARALAIDEPSLGDDHPDLAYDLTCLGEAWLGLGDAKQALPLLEHAEKLRAGTPGADLDRTRKALARARAHG